MVIVAQYTVSRPEQVWAEFIRTCNYHCFVTMRHRSGENPMFLDVQGQGRSFYDWSQRSGTTDEIGHSLPETRDSHRIRGQSEGAKSVLFTNKHLNPLVERVFLFVHLFLSRFSNSSRSIRKNQLFFAISQWTASLLFVQLRSPLCVVTRRVGLLPVIHCC